MGHDEKPYKSVYDLVKSVDNGDFVIPYFQRGYEWNPSMISDLFVSILQDYFAGMLLFWELERKFVDGQRWDPLWGAKQTDRPKYAILDGQQRISSLYYALKGPEISMPGRKSCYNFYIDLNEFFNGDIESCVNYGHNQKYFSLEEILSQKSDWISDKNLPLRIVTDENFFGSKEYYNWTKSYARELVQDKTDEGEVDLFHGKIIDLIQKIRNYEFPVHVLESDRDIVDICNIFARINQKGMRLSIFDLMNAFVYPHGIELKKYWDEVPDDFKNTDPKMNEYQLKQISLFKQGYCSAKYIYYLIPSKSIQKKEADGKKKDTILVKDSQEFLSLWNTSLQNSRNVFSRLKNVGINDFGAISTEYIPNTTMIPVMGAFLWEYENNYKSKISHEKMITVLKKWYWSAIISNDYSGSSDTVMSEDFRDLKTWLDTQDIKSIRRISKVDSNFIDSLDLQQISKGSSLYKGILCILALKSAPDFFTARPLDTGTYVEGSIHDHHIFPQKVIGLPSSTSTLFRKTKDSIVNRTLLLDTTNIIILNKRPSDYLEEMRTALKTDEKRESTLSLHLISRDALSAMADNNYDKFIEERQKSLKNALNEVISE